MSTQRVCDFDEYGVCPCVGDEGGVYECLCEENDDGTACLKCNAVMVLIDVDSGAKVSEARP